MNGEMEYQSEGSHSGRSSSTEEESRDENQLETTNTDDHSNASSSERNEQTSDRDCVGENVKESNSSDEENSEDDEEKQTNGHSEPFRTSSRMSENKLAYQNESNSPNMNNANLDISEWMEKIKTNLKLENRVLIQTMFKDYENLNELKQVLIDTTSLCKEYDKHVAELCEKMSDVKGILKNLHVTMDKKLSEEGLKSWMGDSTNYDLGKV